MSISTEYSSIQEISIRIQYLENCLLEIQNKINELHISQLESKLQQENINGELYNNNSLQNPTFLANCLLLNEDFPYVELQAPSECDLKVRSKKGLQLKAIHLNLRANSILVDSPIINIEGEMAAKITYSKPFIWRCGQTRVRMFPASRGFPILTKVVSASVNIPRYQSTELSIDPDDQYWYLAGNEGIRLLEAVFVGKV